VILTTFADSSSGIGALGFSGTDFLIQLITFLLAYLVLRRYAFGPIIKVMRARRETIESGVKLGEQLRQEQTEMEAKVENIMQKARAEADNVIAGAQDTARQTIREAEDKAKAKADGIIKSSDERIAQDEARSRTKLEREVMGLIGEVASAVVEEKVDSSKDTALIEKVLKERRAA
jgi:F-type H+-transporting ATPase subunit b